MRRTLQYRAYAARPDHRGLPEARRDGHGALDPRAVVRLGRHTVQPELALKKKGLDGDVERVELIMQQGAEFDPTKYIVKDGYLFDSNQGKTVTLDGFNKFIMVIRL
ncbi:hypothetical protein WME75_22455 [Sorangium sp. So ce1014]|uniref:hypothetical protein n=1 Tax=Sorangium sp. So ce1014 TaxID=3133326 RepID=UPI003F61EC87